MKKTWNLKFSNPAEKELKNLDSSIQKRILAFFFQKVLPCENPRFYGKPLTGRLSGYWSYRIGNYRVLVDILDEQLVIVALEIGHRREIYK